MEQGIGERERGKYVRTSWKAGKVMKVEECRAVSYRSESVRALKNI